jgi:hypothetical protein
MVIRKFARAAKILNDSSAEYAEIFVSNSPSPRPQRLRGELSEISRVLRVLRGGKFFTWQNINLR